MVIPEPKIYIRYILLFALFTPFGIMISSIFYKNYELLRGVFLSLASGSFLYVSTSVIIIEEFSLTKKKYSKFFLFLIGGIITGILVLIAGTVKV